MSVPPVNNKFMETVKKMEEKKKHQIKVQEFINNFKREKLREPTLDEVIDNLNSDVPEQMITSILNDMEESNIKLNIDETV